jgi:sec-independent protein translocase protein TatC
MIYTALYEAFFTYIKVAFFAALFLGFPLIASQIWMFVAPGLYKNEKRAFLPFLIATPILFFLGGALVYYLIFPLAWRFFLSFEVTGSGGALPIQLEAKVDEYLSLVMRLIFAFGLCFELPVLMTLLARVGLVGSQGMREKRKYAIVLAFVAAAILTPPDVISQIGLAVPILLLYEISILCVRLVEKKLGEDAQPDEEPDPSDGDDDGDDDIDEDREGR